MDVFKYSIPNYILGIIMVIYPIALIFMSSYIIFSPLMFIVLTGFLDIIILCLFVFFIYRFNRMIKRQYLINYTHWFSLVVSGFILMMICITLIRSLHNYDIGMLTVGIILVIESIYFGVVLILLSLKIFNLSRKYAKKKEKKAFAFYGIIVLLSGLSFISIVASVLGPIILGVSFLQIGYIFSKIELKNQKKI